MFMNEKHFITTCQILLMSSHQVFKKEKKMTARRILQCCNQVHLLYLLNPHNQPITGNSIKKKEISEAELEL